MAYLTFISGNLVDKTLVNSFVLWSNGEPYSEFHTFLYIFEELRDLNGQIIKLTNKNLNTGLISNTFSSDKNSLKYLKTLQYYGLSGVPRLIISSSFYIYSYFCLNTGFVIINIKHIKHRIEEK